MSSRNRYLDATQRKIAAALPRILRDTAERLGAGEPVPAALEAARQALPAAGFERLDYLELADEAALAPRRSLDKPSRLFAAAWLGKTRLIDNWPVAPAKSG
jgi:pantoate--beta-alanine ligase